jgi:hypothetical protein
MWTDNFKLIGHFKMEVIDILTNEVVDSFEKRNLIMDIGRENLVSLVGGINTSYKIGRFAFGTEGHKAGDYSTPKDDTDGFVSTRTQLFSEELGSYTYYVDFIPSMSGSFANVAESDVGAGSTVIVTQTNNVLQYDVEIASLAGNNGSTVNYTEAGFYAGSKLFSMRTFPMKAKNSGVKIKIIWQFVF